MTKQENTLSCSLCPNTEDKVVVISIRPDLNLCDECISLCSDLAKQAREHREHKTAQAQDDPEPDEVLIGA